MSSGASRGSRLWKAAAVGLCVLASAACSKSTVSMPADDASPEQVVRTYADAVHAGDCATADELVSDPSQSWCGAIDITAMVVTGTTGEQKETDSGGGPMVERVAVDLTTEGGDVSLPDGKHEWSYLLERTGRSGAWRIYDQGVG